MGLHSAESQRGNKDMSWYKGSLPNWMLVALVGIGGFVCNRALNEIKDANVRVAEQAIRISVLEAKSASMQDIMTELKLSQKDILFELRGINLQIRNNIK